MIRQGMPCLSKKLIPLMIIKYRRMQNAQIKDQKWSKKRFKVTASGKVSRAQAGKRHGMIKRTPKQIRNKRGTTVLSDSDSRIVKKFLPYA